MELAKKAASTVDGQPGNWKQTTTKNPAHAAALALAAMTFEALRSPSTTATDPTKAQTGTTRQQPSDIPISLCTAASVTKFI